MSSQTRDNEASAATDGYAVGDELAFAVGYGNPQLEIRTIDRITPSGRIVCGNYTLDPSLRLRGRSYGSPYSGQPVTEEIRIECARQENLRVIRNTKFNELDGKLLSQIVSLLKA